MIGRPDARLIVDDTGSRLSATLPPRGLVKLEAILEELKQPRQYEPPLPDPLARERAALAAARVVCNFERQDVSRILADIGRQANVNIGYDYRRIPEARRIDPGRGFDPGRGRDFSYGWRTRDRGICLRHGNGAARKESPARRRRVVWRKS
jgi:hypothetical protein